MKAAKMDNVAMYIQLGKVPDGSGMTPPCEKSQLISFFI